MDTKANEHSRLVKVVLPTAVVRQMDAFINHSSAYADRSEFIADAVQGHLAELAAIESEVSRSHLGERQARLRPEGGLGAEEGLATLSAVDPSTPTLEAVPHPRPDPTWGMHNRDFPTLWAANDLARETGRQGRPIPLEAWMAGLTERAWQLPRLLAADKDRYDFSGFPVNPDKPQASTARFLRFFVSTDLGEGPLFHLGLASSQDDAVAVSKAGADLLTSLAGLSCAKDGEVKPGWTQKFLQHLAVWAPADLTFLVEVLRGIAEGDSSRPQLVGSVLKAHSEWSETVCATNVAGYVARAREWALIAPKQINGRYVLENGAIDLVNSTVETSGSNKEQPK